MSGRPRSLRIAAVALAALGTVAIVLPSWRSTAGPTVRSAGVEARTAALADLRSRVLPSATGGWVVGERTGEPAPDRWLLAASASGSELDRVEAAVVAASTGTDRELRGRAVAALATAAAVAGAELDDARGAAAAAWQAAQAQRAAGDPAWLGVALHLAIGPAPTAATALDELRSAAGDPTCADLPAGPPPAPGGALVVLVRVLAADGRSCEQARPLLEGVVVDPAWAAPIAVAEVADLLSLVPDPDDELVRALTERFERWADPGGGTVADLAVLAELRRAWAILGRAPAWPTGVGMRLATVVLAEGRVADRAVQAPAPLDLLALRLLAAEGLVPADAVAATLDHLEAPVDGDEAVGAALVVRGARPGCADEAPAPGARSTLLEAVARGARSVQAAACAGRPIDAVAAEAAAAPVGRRPFEVIGVVLAACRAAPGSLADGVDLDLADDPFAADAVGLVATVLALDPPAACAAMGWP